VNALDILGLNADDENKKAKFKSSLIALQNAIDEPKRTLGLLSKEQSPKNKNSKTLIKTEGQDDVITIISNSSDSDEDWEYDPRAHAQTIESPVHGVV
jgi:hypothetical protein